MSNYDDVAKHYNEHKSIDKNIRKQSKIIHIRNMHNFIKSILIIKYIKNKKSVLDLGCGKGGDLKKYTNHKIDFYFGIDIAEKSVEEAKKRYLTMQNIFKADFLAQDAYGQIFNLNRKFDFISSQFSLHYAFQSEESFKTSIINISQHLEKDGYFVATIPNIYTLMRRYKNHGNNFGNDYYCVRFDKSYNEIIENGCKFGISYDFSLAEAINDCKEYLVPYSFLIEAFKEKGIELVEHKPLLDFYNENAKENLELHDRLIVKRLDNDELKVTELYSVIVFKKT
ncbi:mRNA cap guanine-N7 methyltransferase [Gurleya vavrai]